MHCELFPSSSPLLVPRCLKYYNLSGSFYFYRWAGWLLRVWYNRIKLSHVGNTLLLFYKEKIFVCAWLKLLLHISSQFSTVAEWMSIFLLKMVSYAPTKTPALLMFYILYLSFHYNTSTVFISLSSMHALFIRGLEAAQVPNCGCADWLAYKSRLPGWKAGQMRTVDITGNINI